MIKASTFSTTDTKLAAWLVIKGIGYLEIRRFNHSSSAEFVFPDSTKRQSLSAEFASRSTEDAILVRAFHDEYKRLISKIRGNDND